MPSSSQRAKSAGTDYPCCSLFVETVLGSSIQKQSAKESEIISAHFFLLLPCFLSYLNKVLVVHTTDPIQKHLSR